MDIETRWKIGALALALLITVSLLVMSGCKTAQKVESPEWHYNMGKQDGMKEAMAAARAEVQRAQLTLDDARLGWRQCEERLTECLEAGKEK